MREFRQAITTNDERTTTNAPMTDRSKDLSYLTATSVINLMESTRYLLHILTPLLRHSSNNGVRKLPSRHPTADIARHMLALRINLLDRLMQPRRRIDLPQVPQHHRRRQHQRRRVRNPLSCYVGCAPVDRLENRILRAHVRARHHAQPPPQPRRQVRY